MRILSKYKDYYDYFTGIYGIDNNKVYDRREVLDFSNTRTSWDTEYGVITFAICGTIYTMYVYRGEIYHTPEEMEKLDMEIREHSSYKYDKLRLSFWESSLKRGENPYEKQYSLTNNIPTKINIKRREPVLVEISSFKYQSKFKSEDFSVPLLESFEFYRVLDPKEIYIQIETFLGWLVDNPPLPDTQTNIGKIEGHGFDKKTSFRPNMK